MLEQLIHIQGPTCLLLLPGSPFLRAVFYCTVRHIRSIGDIGEASLRETIMSFAGIDVPKNAIPLLGVELSFTIVAIVSVALRVLTRTWLIKHMGFDDLFIILSAVILLSPLSLG